MGHAAAEAKQSRHDSDTRIVFLSARLGWRRRGEGFATQTASQHFQFMNVSAVIGGCPNKWITGAGLAEHAACLSCNQDRYPGLSVGWLTLILRAPV